MRRLAAVFALIIPSVAVTMAIAAPGREYRAHLIGQYVVPPVATEAQGQARFTPSRDGEAIHFKLIVSAIEDVGGAELRLGPQGANGEVVAVLYAGPVKEGRQDGLLVQGALIGASLSGPLEGRGLGALIEQIEQGSIYIIVHTQAHPTGEIRGQLR